MKGKDWLAPQISFVDVELDTGLTFARLASTAKYEDRIERNQANARKAYDVAFRLIARVEFPETTTVELQAKLALLKSELQQLGEVI